MWYGEPINFANGLALGPDERHLYVAETFGNAVFRIPIREDGSAGTREEVASLPARSRTDWPSTPPATCTSAATSQVLRVAPDGTVECLIRDKEAFLLCHPTNVAFRDNILFTANLGRCHITAIQTTVEGLPLYGGYGGGR